VLSERVAGLERELSTVRQTSDDERQRLTSELEVARAALDDLKAGQLVSQSETIGRLTAELEARTAIQTPDPSSGLLSSVWRRWWLLLLGLTGCAAVVLLLVWPR